MTKDPKSDQSGRNQVRSSGTLALLPQVEDGQRCYDVRDLQGVLLVVGSKPEERLMFSKSHTTLPFQFNLYCIVDDNILIHALGCLALQRSRPRP